MPTREYRVSPDGKSIAIRTDEPDLTEWNSWGVVHCKIGGHWATAAEVEDWATVPGSDREYLVSPDGRAVAVRTDNPDPESKAWGVIHCDNGAHWSASSELEDWLVITASGEPAPADPPVEDPPVEDPPVEDPYPLGDPL
jgi:hypothetical protein